ncbi:putative hAT family C-terminal dimerization region-containing protein 15 [Homarus americanus]|uniref:Putative hAT family C-terminal dimerization region-containing protein 15 n=1 Tax=Homarus americanus TaxID=6706 RepID=A0A8J5TKM5_HOMAM|nr:putative hAT family C-terminal dimerization region-containing protein 15 [Homarus americanus]
MVDYGAKFMHELYTFINQQNHSAEAVGKVDEVKKRCAGLLSEALKQVESRLPASMGIFKGLSVFAPCKVLNQTERVPFKDFPLPHLRSEKEDTIEQHYRKIHHLPWAEESVFDGKIPTDSISFRSGVLQYKNSTGKRPFEELGTYAMVCLTTPTSNAVVERIFSTVTNVKTKSRNHLGSEMLDTIIRVHSHFQFQGKCCRDFKVTPHMMELFNSAKEEPGDEDELDVFAYVN